MPINMEQMMEKTEILKKLNDEQYLPASVVDGAILVTAGAGSGKTHLLTHRIAHMVTDLGISPANILSITFTNKAANEMKERLAKMIDGSEYMWICTFHAMCAKLLRYHAERIGFSKSFSIYGDTEKSRVIKRIIENKNTEINAETFAWHISNAKNNLLSPDEYSRYIRDPKKCMIITSVYSEYQEELKKANCLDFDDLLVKTYELITSCPDLRELYQEKFRYIFVDEFQDTNTAQYELVKILSGKYKNIFVVGDEDQCIYSWRGAQVENIRRFTEDYKNCKIFKLEQNYRSTKKIIALANKLIKNNRERIDKNLWTENDDGYDVDLSQPYSDIEEAEQVAQRIEAMISMGAKYSDFAVLMRVNSQSRIVEEKFLNYNIPYKIYGGFKFFERKEIKDTTAYLYLVSNPNDIEATNRMLSFPKKGIGNVSMNLISELADKNNVSEMEIIMNAEKYGISGSLLSKLNQVRDIFSDLNEKKDKLSLVDFVSYMIEKIKIKEAIGSKTEDDVNKCMNVDDLIKSVSEFATSNEGATIDDFLQSITLMRDIDSMNSEDDYVSIITVHASKGLEFKNVFIIGLNDGLFPLSRAINSPDPNELEEERRLMYVAITRAKKRLFLSRSKTRFNYEKHISDFAIISRFLPEMFDNLKSNNTIKNSSIYHINSGESEQFYGENERKKNLDYNMSSHINIVNVSGKKPEPSNSDYTILTQDYSKFKKGVKVTHSHFGEGIITVGVTDFASAFVTIKFNTVGIKTLSLKYAKLKIID